MSNTRTDQHIQNDVQAELIWDPEVNSIEIGVIAADGIVTLRGIVEMYGEKWAAERDTLRIDGVRALANTLTVKAIKSQQHTDSDIALRVTAAKMSERAECVMLNKGPFIFAAVDLLDDVRLRMQAHQHNSKMYHRCNTVTARRVMNELHTNVVRECYTFLGCS